jgi:hypothetical protein
MLISLTTTPIRIGKLQLILKALKKTLRCPDDRIVIHIPTTFKRTGEAYVLPEFLL